MSVGAVDSGVTTRATVGKFAGRARKSHLDCCFFVTRGEDDVVVAAAGVPGCRKFSKVKFSWSRLLSFVERKGKERQEARRQLPSLLKLGSEARQVLERAKAPRR